LQRVTKYQLLLKDLLSCCEGEKGGGGGSEIREGLEVRFVVLSDTHTFKREARSLVSLVHFMHAFLLSQVCLNVPKKANDALHLSMLEGCDLSNEELGEVVLQDSFQV